jgi:hypothetical protein
VIQVNNEPSDPEFDRLGSHSLTGSFLDEAQQMVTKVRSVLSWRYSQTSGDFKFKVPYQWKMPDEKSIGFTLDIDIIGKAEFKKWDLIKDDFVDIKKDGKYWLGITRREKLFIPYRVIDYKIEGNFIEYHCAWEFVACSLLSCNPGKNFTYTDFWKPFAKWELPKNRKFIRALVQDNPFIERDYILRLERSDDEITKQRLLYGNFEYDDDPTLLFTAQTLDKMFTWEMWGGERYITVDAARLGKDRTVIMVWEWLTIIDILEIKSGTLDTQKTQIRGLIESYNVDIDNVIVDEVGVGWGLVDMLWCKGFIANASPIHPVSSKLLKYKRRNFSNLRTQAFYYVKRFIEEGKLKIKKCTLSQKETIIEELLFIKQDSVDDDKKISLQSKKDMKALLGRSPDYADWLSFRMYWILKDIQERWYEAEIDEETVDWTPIWLMIKEWEDELNKKNESWDIDFAIY